VYKKAIHRDAAASHGKQWWLAATKILHIGWVA